MRSRSRPSARPSTTSSRTSKRDRSGEGGALARLIEALPSERRDQVFTHTSWAPDRASSYERLEFLGDSVLELAIARVLYDRFPDAIEGRLAKIRAHVVSRQSCAAVAKDLDLVHFLLEQAQDVPGAELDRISTQQERPGGAARGGDRGGLPRARLRAVERAVVEAFDERIEFALTGHVDNKTELQEALARTGNRCSTRSSRSMARRTTGASCAPSCRGRAVGLGRGSTKKAAEQEAARQALEALGLV